MNTRQPNWPVNRTSCSYKIWSCDVNTPTFEAWPSNVVANPRWRQRTSLRLRESESLYLLSKIVEKLDKVFLIKLRIVSEYNMGKSTATDVQKSRSKITEAVDCFSICLEWLEQQPEAIPALMLLRRLLDLAGQKRGSALMQNTMDCYFSNPWIHSYTLSYCSPCSSRSRNECNGYNTWAEFSNNL